MYLTNLLDVVKTSGLTVHVVSGWETRGHGGMSGVRGALCHDTVGPSAGNMPSLSVLINGRPGLSGPLSQLGLARDGSAVVIAAGMCYHAGAGSGFGLPVDDANPWLVGIEAESTGMGDWTAAQLNAYPRLVAALVAGYRFPVSMAIGHYEWTPRKIDPSGWPGGMPALRAATARVLQTPTPTTQGDDPMASQRAIIIQENGFSAEWLSVDCQELTWIRNDRHRAVIQYAMAHRLASPDTKVIKIPAGELDYYGVRTGPQPPAGDCSPAPA